MERKKVFKLTNLNEFVKLFWLYISLNNNKDRGRAKQHAPWATWYRLGQSQVWDLGLARRRIARNVFLKARGSLCEKNSICFDGLFIYISESRSSSLNHSNDIASTNKVVKSENGSLEAKHAITFPLLLTIT